MIISKYSLLASKLLDAKGITYEQYLKVEPDGKVVVARSDRLIIVEQVKDAGVLEHPIYLHKETAERILNHLASLKKLDFVELEEDARGLKFKFLDPDGVGVIDLPNQREVSYPDYKKALKENFCMDMRVWIKLTRLEELLRVIRVMCLPDVQVKMKGSCLVIQGLTRYNQKVLGVMVMQSGKCMEWLNLFGKMKA